MKLHENKFELLTYRGSVTVNKAALSQCAFSNEFLQYRTSDNGILYPSSFVKDLGVYATPDLMSTIHVNKMVESANRMANWVLSVFMVRTAEVMLNLFKSMVRSMLEYCCPVWDPSTIPNIQKVESTQRSFTQYIKGCKGLTYWERLKVLDILSLQRRRERYIIIHIWKIIHGQSPNDVSLVYYEHPRLGMRCKIPPLPNAAARSAKTAFDQSFAVKGPQLWNILLPEINLMKTLDPFKRKLTHFIKDRFPDKPPVHGYACQNSNSLLEWTMLPAGRLQQIA